MNDRQIDQVLVERAQKGDHKAFEMLMSKYQRRLNRLISRFIQDEHEVHDVTQEAMIRAYRALVNFRGESAFYTWLYRIGINTAKNFLTTSGRQFFVSSEAANEEGDVLDLTDQIADCPIGTVRSRIFRARELIAKDLRPLLDTSEDQRW